MRYDSAFFLILLLVFAAVGLATSAVRADPAATTGLCPPVKNTTQSTIVYGNVSLDGADAPVGTVIEMHSPRGDVVGCQITTDAGIYATTYVYGEDTSVNPPLPGMKSGEAISFLINGVIATASPPLTWSNDRLTSPPHQVNLSATGVAVPVSPLVTGETGGSGNDDDLVLTWRHASQHTNYEVWRSVIPYFTPGSGNTLIANGLPPSPGCSFSNGEFTCTDPGILANTGCNFYLIRAFNASGAFTDSGQIGVFSFSLTSGS